LSTSFFWRLAGRLFAGSFRFVPQRHRFHLAATLAGALVPLLRFSRAWREHLKPGFDTDHEIALDLLLMMLTRHGVLYDPQTTVEHEELVYEAIRSPNGTLFIGVHMMLSALFIRYLRDAGIRFAAVTIGPLTLAGTNEQVEVLAGPMVLRDAARRLRDGCVVLALIDRTDPQPNVIEFETVRGTKRIADAFVRLAIHENAGILFFCGRLHGRSEVRIAIGRPAAGSSGSADAVARDFIAFVQAETARS